LKITVMNPKNHVGGGVLVSNNCQTRVFSFFYILFHTHMFKTLSSATSIFWSSYSQP
jgi:hypothetical protein